MDDEINELTLSVMANRTKYDKCKKNIAQGSATIQEAFQKEKLYYKERILHMTRDLFHERCENDTINVAHQEYLKSCIEYLKWNDITEMVDGDTRNEVRGGEVKARQGDALMELTDARAAVERQIQETVFASCGDDDDTVPPSSPLPAPRLSCHNNNNNNDILSIANKMCIRKKTIDDFIILKPVARPDDDEINARLPKIRDYHNEITRRTEEAAASASAAAVASAAGANTIGKVSSTPPL
jgi:hypothetical protein